jgi:hypothetical protein
MRNHEPSGRKVIADWEGVMFGMSMAWMVDSDVDGHSALVGTLEQGLCTIVYGLFLRA